MAAAKANKNRKKRVISPFTILLIITAVLTLAAAGIVIYQNIDLQADSPRKIADAPAGELAFIPEAEESTNLYALGSTRLIRLNKSRIELLNLSGSAEESISTTLATPQVVTVADYALIYDQGGFKYYLFDRNGLIYTGTSNDPIESVSLSSDGLVSLILDRMDTNGVLRVLSGDGSLLMEWVALDSQNSGYIIVADFAYDSSYIDVSLLNTNRSDTTSLVNRFSLEAVRLGERIAQYQLDSDSAILKIINASQKTAFVSDRHLYTVNQGSVLEAANFASIYAATRYGEGTAIVAADSIGGRYKLYCLTDLAAMNPGTGLELGENPGIPVSRGRYTAIADGEELILISNADMSRVSRFDMKSSILSVGLDDNGNILLVTRDEVRRLTP